MLRFIFLDTFQYFGKWILADVVRYIVVHGLQMSRGNKYKVKNILAVADRGP